MWLAPLLFVCGFILFLAGFGLFIEVASNGPKRTAEKFVEFKKELKEAVKILLGTNKK